MLKKIHERMKTVEVRVQRTAELDTIAGPVQTIIHEFSKHKVVLFAVPPILEEIAGNVHGKLIGFIIALENPAFGMTKTVNQSEMVFIVLQTVDGESAPYLTFHPSPTFRAGLMFDQDILFSSERWPWYMVMPAIMPGVSLRSTYTIQWLDTSHTAEG